MNKNKETSWYILTFNNLKGIETENTDIKKKEESLDTQDNDDYAWENM